MYVIESLKHHLSYTREENERKQSNVKELQKQIDGLKLEIELADKRITEVKKAIELLESAEKEDDE
jgi:prefoldin subunit 5